MHPLPSGVGQLRPNMRIFGHLRPASSPHMCELCSWVPNSRSILSGTKIVPKAYFLTIRISLPTSSNLGLTAIHVTTGVVKNKSKNNKTTNYSYFFKFLDNNLRETIYTYSSLAIFSFGLG